MTHIYAVKSVSAERSAQRRHLIAEIKILRRFEGRKIIEERIAKNINKLHALWFRQ